MFLDPDARLGLRRAARPALAKGEVGRGSSSGALIFTQAAGVRRCQARVGANYRKACAGFPRRNPYQGETGTEDALKAQVTRKDTQIAAMNRTIEELKRKAEQGSQQIQGEALELELEGLLRGKFPLDVVEPVGKGEFGGDIVQHVNGAVGPSAGIILWEFKRTKNWSDGWLSKLREDQRAAKADTALIISQTLPKDVETFDLIDGVWVAHPRCAIPVAVALRHALIELAGSRNAQLGQQTKMELVYQYLTGPRFRQRLEGIIEKFDELKDDLDKERKFMNRVWAKREGQIQGVQIRQRACGATCRALWAKRYPKLLRWIPRCWSHATTEDAELRSKS
jgi:hypothetical protein